MLRRTARTRGGYGSPANTIKLRTLSRPSPAAMAAICSEDMLLHEELESALPVSTNPPSRQDLESSPPSAHQHAIEGCKIVTTDHASTLFEMQRRLVPQGRPGASLACHCQPRVAASYHTYPPSSTLKHPSIALHDGHDQMFTCPDAQRLEAASCLLRTLSYSTRPFKALTPNDTPRPPVLAPEMRIPTSQPDCQTFLRRWNLADPTTAAEPGIRASPNAQSRAREI